MKRRAFLGVLGGALAWPLAAGGRPAQKSRELVFCGTREIGGEEPSKMV